MSKTAYIDRMDLLPLYLCEFIRETCHALLLYAVFVPDNADLSKFKACSYSIAFVKKKANAQ
ncbi:MAG: hypothetical protein Q8L68_06080 [Methylococcales bacterium]|nr:hypothetical protein [Methylococcales bacterium]